MKHIFSTAIFFFVFTLLLQAQTVEKKTYPLVVSFQSICCGVPSDSVLINYIKNFKKKCKVNKITACHIGPMGREGEFYIAFELNELTKKQKNNFITAVQKIKKAPKDRGILSFKKDHTVDPELLSKRVRAEIVIY